MRGGPSSRGRESLYVGLVGPFSGAGTHKAIYANRPSRQSGPPSVGYKVQSKSVPSPPILKRSHSGLSGKR